MTEWSHVIMGTSDLQLNAIRPQGHKKIEYLAQEKLLNVFHFILLSHFEQNHSDFCKNFQKVCQSAS